MDEDYLEDLIGEAFRVEDAVYVPNPDNVTHKLLALQVVMLTRIASGVEALLIEEQFKRQQR